MHTIDQFSEFDDEGEKVAKMDDTDSDEIPDFNGDIESLRKDTVENQDWVRNRIKFLRDKYPEIKPKLAAKQILKITKATINIAKFNNFLYNDTTLDRFHHELFVNYLWEHSLCSDLWLKEGLAKHEDALFHALCNFLSVQDHDVTKMHASLPGFFRIWRASMYAPGSYIMGMMQISKNKHSYALKTVETHRKNSDKWTDERNEVFEGYVTTKGAYHLIIARQVMFHDGSPRVTVIHNVDHHPKSGVVTFMHGVVIGCYGTNELFSTPVYMERVRDEDVEKLKEEIDIVESVPSYIEGKLRFNMIGNTIKF